MTCARFFRMIFRNTTSIRAKKSNLVDYVGYAADRTPSVLTGRDSFGGSKADISRRVSHGSIARLCHVNTLRAHSNDCMAANGNAEEFARPYWYILEAFL